MISFGQWWTRFDTVSAIQATKQATKVTNTQEADFLTSCARLGGHPLIFTRKARQRAFVTHGRPFQRVTTHISPLGSLKR